MVLRDGSDLDGGRTSGRTSTGRVAKWWIPERFEFIEEVPKTSVGKFDKKVLRARCVAGEAPLGSRPA